MQWWQTKEEHKKEDLETPMGKSTKTQNMGKARLDQEMNLERD